MVLVVTDPDVVVTEPVVTAPTLSSTTNPTASKSNAGGVTRGLERANAVAGGGAHGRLNAATKQTPGTKTPKDPEVVVTDPDVVVTEPVVTAPSGANLI
jgi:hypothetical protein